MTYARQHRPKLHPVHLVAALTLLVLSLALPAPSRGAYDYSELPFATDWSSTQAYGINASGAVVGFGMSATDTMYKGFVYASGAYVPVIPPTWSSSQAYAINQSGAVTGLGYVSHGDFSKGFVYSGGSASTYTTLTPGLTKVSTQGINAVGAVVGTGEETRDTGKACSGSVYTPGTGGGTYTLLQPSGSLDSYATGINDAGTVVGYRLTQLAHTYSGFIYQNGVYTDLLPPNWSDARAIAINTNGLVAGDGLDGLTSVPKVFLYNSTTGSYTSLLSLPQGWTQAHVTGINDLGDVVGWGKDADGKQKGFLYKGGVFEEIQPVGWAGVQATGINDSRMIVGWGTDPSGAIAGFTGQPITAAVPVPASLLLFGPGLAGLAAIRRRFKK
jgi:probable HAF family extracellular repeat protein